MKVVKRYRFPVYVGEDGGGGGVIFSMVTVENAAVWYT